MRYASPPPSRNARSVASLAGSRFALASSAGRSPEYVTLAGIAGAVAVAVVVSSEAGVAGEVAVGVAGASVSVAVAVAVEAAG